MIDLAQIQQQQKIDEVIWISLAPFSCNDSVKPDPSGPVMVVTSWYPFVLVVLIGRRSTREAPPQTGLVDASGHAWQAGSGKNSPVRTRWCRRASAQVLEPSAVFCFQSQALISIKADRTKANDGLSAALLVVFLDSARNLPVSRVPTSQHAPGL